MTIHEDIPVSGKADALIRDLMKIHPKGFDLSLDRVTGLLEKLGNPQHAIPPAIHVAGTNGKGSTIAFCRAILEAGGKSAHVHTSPHLVNWHERYRLGVANAPGELVSDEVLADAIARVSVQNQGRPITVFEILSAVMFVLFSEHKADYSLVEVGLGGRFDATNVIRSPAVSVIAPVALDHQAYLGDTIAKIAFEKAGIIKPGCPVAVGRQEDDAIDVILEVAEKNGSVVMLAGQDFECYEQGGRLIYNDEDGLLDLPLPSLSGRHQIDNAGLAIAAIRMAGIKISDQAYETAMKSVTWPGRMERLPAGKIHKALGNDVPVWIDGGHNPSAGEAIAVELAALFKRTGLPPVFITAMLTTKEPDGYFAPFKGLVSEVITIPITSSEAGFSPKDLAGFASRAGLNATPMESLEAAVDSVSRRIADGEALQVMFCGSLYLVGEVLEKNGTPPR